MPVVNGEEVLNFTPDQLDILLAKAATYPILDSNAMHYLNGSGGWTTPAGGSGSSVLIDVTYYGAMGDGITNDTTAIQTALNAAHTAGGGEVYIPRTSSYYMVDKLTIYSNTHLILKGSLKLNSSVNDNLLYCYSSTNILIDGGGIIDGNGTNQQNITGHNIGGIYVDTCTKVTIRDITIQYARHWNINTVHSSFVLLDNLTTTQGGAANEFAWDSHDCWAVNCDFSYVVDIIFAFYGGVYNSGIIGCNVHDSISTNGGIGVYSDAAQTALCHDITIANNIIYNIGGDGILVMATNGVIHYNINIIGNNCHHNGQGNANTTDIKIYTSKYVNVLGNICANNGNGNNGSMGIYIETTASYLTIANNFIYNQGIGSTTGIGIAINGGNYLFIDSNTIIDDQSTKTTIYGIAGTPGNNCKITNNQLSSFLGSPFSIASHGTNNLYINNSGYNPVGHVTSPSIPASGAWYTNNQYAFPCYVYIHGGTVSDIGFEGLSTGLTSGMFYIGIGQQISIAYTVAPTWTWFGV